MNDLASMFWIELRKAVRSRVLLFISLGFMILPLVGALLMFIYKDPEFARRIGILSMKANLAGGSADWPFYLSFYGQAIAVGGLIIFSLIETWLFGREFADGTLKDLLAVPVPRGAILLAKFILFALWSFVLTGLVYLVGLFFGGLLELPLWSTGLIIQGSLTLLITTCLVILAITPVAWLASVGRGYLLPMGITLLLVGLANLIVILGWGSYFPWAVPGIYAGLAGQLEPAGYWIVLLTGLAGILGTYFWWKYADQSR